MVNKSVILQLKVRDYLFKDQHLCFGIKKQTAFTPAISWQDSRASVP